MNAFTCQDKPEPIETNLVMLNAAATNKNGNYVRPLPKNDLLC
jgi:hypothetical protein